MSLVGEILEGLWRFEALHPEWAEEDDGWDPLVAWWAVRTGRGLLLIDPLVSDWEDLDRLVDEQGGCSGILRTIHFHKRSVAEAAARYKAEVWAGRTAAGETLAPLDHQLDDGDELWDGIKVFDTERFDERAVWVPTQSALLFGDAMLRREGGRLQPCPNSWTQPTGGSQRLRELLRGIAERCPAEHVLVSHGPQLMGDGREALAAALG